jgi:hypothetical protein
MDPTFNSSFIPKRSLQTGTGGKGGGKYVKRRSLYGPGFFVSALLFATSLIVAFGMFAAIEVIDLRINDNLVKAENMQQEMDPSEIARWKRTTLRLTEAQKIVENHQAVTGLLREIESNTLKNVQYIEFAYDATKGATRNTSRANINNENTLISLTLSGKTQDLAHVAVQGDQYRNHVENYFFNTHVSDIEQIDGYVNFEMYTGVDARVVLFSRVIADNVYSTIPQTVIPSGIITY